jgi:hypothetical protein
MGAEHVVWNFSGAWLRGPWDAGRAGAESTGAGSDWRTGSEWAKLRCPCRGQIFSETRSHDRGQPESVLIINTGQPFSSPHDELHPGEPRPANPRPARLTPVPAREARSVEPLPAPRRIHSARFAGEGTYANVFKVRFVFSLCTFLISKGRDDHVPPTRLLH